jgi:hypothetical protein
MQQQRGMTLISWVLVLALIGFFATLAIRLVPMYQEYFSVVKVMNQMEQELKDNQYSKQQVMLYLQRRFDIDYISSVKNDDIEIYRGRETPYVTKIVLDYEVRKPFIAQIDLIGHFHKEIDTESDKQ